MENKEFTINHLIEFQNYLNVAPVPKLTEEDINRSEQYVNFMKNVVTKILNNEQNNK